MQPEQIFYELTHQEHRVLHLVAQDLPNRDLADKLCVSPHTVKNHKANLIKKLGLCSATALHHLAIELASHPLFQEKWQNRGGNLLIISRLTNKKIKRMKMDLLFF